MKLTTYVRMYKINASGTGVDWDDVPFEASRENDSDGVPLHETTHFEAETEAWAALANLLMSEIPKRKKKR